MGSMQPPKQFSAPGVMLSPDQQNAVTQSAQALPKQPLNPNLMMNMNQIPTVSSPNATPSPILPGVSNNPNQPNPLGYPSPGGNGGQFGSTLPGAPIARPIGGPVRRMPMQPVRTAAY